MSEFNYQFDIRFYIFHPTIQLQQIIEILHLPMQWGWNVGDASKSPKGNIISQRARTSTYWAYRKTIHGQKHFFKYVVAFYQNLILDNKIKDFLKHITDTEGKIYLEVHLYEGTDIGDILDSADLLFLAENNIKFGLELIKK